MNIKPYQIILFFALLISCTSAYITISGLADIYKHAGYLTVLLIATAIESTRISSIYFISLFWKKLGKIFKSIGCTFILCACLISAIGVSGFFFSAFQDSQNQVSSLEISSNTNNALIANLQQQIQSEQENIRNLQTQLTAEVSVYDNLKNNNEDGSLTQQQKNSLSRKRSIQNQITSSNKEIKKLNEEIIKQTKESSESQKAVVEAAPELARLRSISKMFGFSAESTLLSVLTLLIIFCFDPFGIWLMLFSNKVRNIKEEKPEIIDDNSELKKEEKASNKKVKKKEPDNIEIGINDYTIIKEPIVKKLIKKIKKKEEKEIISEIPKSTEPVKPTIKLFTRESKHNNKFTLKSRKLQTKKEAS